MANLSEQESWIDGIYQLETSDPVVAGPGGISNRQAEQLASRTAYLKKMQETTGESLQKHLAASDPHSQYAPKNSPALTGTPTAPTTAQTANNTQIATTAFVKSALAALVNGSPAALDTLQELANALGNDPHFSTTVVNAIADVKTDVANKLNAHTSMLDAHPQYAPKISPALTGKPTAPTAIQASNDTQIATTAFVKAAITALVNGSPAALDTLQELANALGNDPNFSTTILNALAGKLAKDQNGADIPDKAKFRENVGLETQTSSTDATPNRILKLAANGEGIFGLGGASTRLVDVNHETYFNASTPSGFYTLSGQVASTKMLDGFIDTFIEWRKTTPYTGNRVYGRLIVSAFASNAHGLRTICRELHAVSGWSDWIEDWNSKSLPSPMTLNTIQTIGVPKFFTGSDAPIRLVSRASGVAVYMPFFDSDGTRFGWVGRGSTNNDIRLNNDIASSGITLASDGNINLSTAGAGIVSWNGQQVIMSGNTQSITGTKRFTVPPVFVGESYSAGFDTENTQITENTVGRWLQFRNNGAGSARFYIRAGANGKPTPSNERIVDLPVAASGSILVTGNNAVADANGLWIVPGSAGSVSINDLTGIPLPFPGAVAPTGWLKCNGQSFSKTLYPILASRYPSGVLPDLRGEFVRGWDDGRGADAGRALLSVQGDAIRSHKHSITMSHEPAGTKDSSGFPATDGSEPFIVHSETNPDGSVSDTTGKGNPLHSFGGNETRPRNIAFNYIVRAA